MNKINQFEKSTSVGIALQSAMKSLSKKKQTEIIADYIYSKNVLI